MGPLDELRDRRRGRRGRAARRQARPERAADAESGRRSRASATTRPTPRCCWRRRWARRRARSPSGWPARCPGGWASAWSASRWPGRAFQRLPGRGLVRDRARGPAGGRRPLGAGAPEQPEKVPRRVRLRQPDRAADGGPAATRRSATRLRGSSSWRATRSSASTTSTTAAPDRPPRASISARARGEDLPEDGYVGDYVFGLAQAIPGAADADPPSWPSGGRVDHGGHPGDARAYRVDVRLLVPRALPPRGRAQRGRAHARRC